jgi:hypothetical protein
MMKRFFNNLIVFILFGIANGCNSQELDYSLASKYGTFKYSVIDTNTVKDFLKVCDKEIPIICNELNIDFENSIIIEIYPNQEKYNYSIINSDLKNSPAISGDDRIQLVSPLSPLEVEKKIRTVKYSDRMNFLIHEYVHILIDRLEYPPPLCIDEGIASFYSSRGFYLDMATRYVKQINYIPSIEELIANYDKLPAPDLFSFLLIDYVVQSQGKEKLGDIIRQSSYIKQFNDKWNEYVKNKYY